MSSQIKSKPLNRTDFQLRQRARAREWKIECQSEFAGLFN